jgi:3-methyladenine DNA glycosylase Mpg
MYECLSGLMLPTRIAASETLVHNEAYLCVCRKMQTSHARSGRLGHGKVLLGFPAAAAKLSHYGMCVCAGVVQVTVEGFGPFAQAITYPLAGRGVVAVTGTNRDDAAAVSNGAGKTSLLTSLLWAFKVRLTSYLAKPEP